MPKLFFRQPDNHTVNFSTRLTWAEEDEMNSQMAIMRLTRSVFIRLAVTYFTRHLKEFNENNKIKEEVVDAQI